LTRLLITVGSVDWPPVPRPLTSKGSLVFEHIPTGRVSMSDSSVLNPEAPASDLSSVQLPISSIVRAVCEAANGGPDLLYEVMMKMSLMVEATAPTYG